MLIFWFHFLFFFSDSPGVPPSATAHELFRGFSYVAPGLLIDGTGNASTDTIVASMTSNNNCDLSSISVSFRVVSHFEYNQMASFDVPTYAYVIYLIFRIEIIQKGSKLHLILDISMQP